MHVPTPKELQGYGEIICLLWASQCCCRSSCSGCTLHKCTQMMEQVETKIQLMLQSPNQWPKLSLWSSWKKPFPNFPNASVRTGTSQISSVIHIFSCCYLILRLKSFIFPKYTRYSNSPGCVSIISAAICPLIVHLGKSSFSNAPRSGKALCIPPTWNFLFSPYPGNSYWGLCHSGLDCAFGWESISSTCFWVIWQQNPEQNPFTFAVLS